MLFYLSLIDTAEEKSKFEKIYICYRQIMFYTANCILHDKYLAEDAVHTSFLKIISNFDKIDDVNCSKTKNFVLVIAENTALDIYRKKKAENNIFFDESEFFFEKEKTEEIFDNEVENQILHLPVIYKNVLRLKYIQGYSIAEISELLEISAKTAQKRLERGKTLLSKILSKEGIINVKE